MMTHADSFTNTSISVMPDSPDPVNDPISDFELLARNIYATSQYSSSKGLKKNRLYPNYKKESRQFKGFHVCRIYMQRLCHAKWSEAIRWALAVKSQNQTLIGFEFAPAYIALNYNFAVEPAASEKNPYHAHIRFDSLNKPYPQPDNVLDEVMASGLRRRIDEMTSHFKFVTLEDIANNQFHDISSCPECLSNK